MTKTAQLKQKPLSRQELNLLEIIEAYESSKMTGLTLEEFVRNYADMFATEEN
jgi:hypothetical protein